MASSNASSGAKKVSGGKPVRKENAFSVEQWRVGLGAVLDAWTAGRNMSAGAACTAGGIDGCETSMLRRIGDMAAVTGPGYYPSAAVTLAARRDWVARFSFPEKGNPNWNVRKVFSDTDRQYFAAALKLFGELGWPQDDDLLATMFADAAANMVDPSTGARGLTDPDTGEPYLFRRATHTPRSA